MVQRVVQFELVLESMILPRHPKILHDRKIECLNTSRPKDVAACIPDGIRFRNFSEISVCSISIEVLNGDAVQADAWVDEGTYRIADETIDTGQAIARVNTCKRRER